MKTLCFTVDLDRDVNEPVIGSMHAGSADFGDGNSPRFSSAGKGTEMIAEMLDDLGIKATFFAEARALQRSGSSDFISGHDVALHGLDHEDFTGDKTGVHLDEGDMREVIEKAISLIRDCVGYQPKGFRSPYMSVNEELMYILPEYGIRYDSSYYAYLQSKVMPYRHESGLIEFPVAKGTDPSGKSITSYLWPMHEGARGPEEFIRMARGMDDGVYVLATHSWHICENYSSGLLDREMCSKNIDNIRLILETLQDDGFKVCLMSDMVN